MNFYSISMHVDSVALNLNFEYMHYEQNMGIILKYKSDKLTYKALTLHAYSYKKKQQKLQFAFD